MADQKQMTEVEWLLSMLSPSTLKEVLADLEEPSVLDAPQLQEKLVADCKRAIASVL